jgi:uncharacterized membrane protein YhaH (DUF805 family)
MNFTTAIATCFSKYATFSGRARRAEYWWFVLFTILADIVLKIADAAIFGQGGRALHEGAPALLSGLFSLAVFLPSLAVGVRRLHDTGRSGWWLLIWFIPVIGWIVLIWWLASRGEAGPNRHGPDPLAQESYSPSPIPRVRRP